MVRNEESELSEQMTTWLWSFAHFGTDHLAWLLEATRKADNLRLLRNKKENLDINYIE